MLFPSDLTCIHLYLSLQEDSNKSLGWANHEPGLSKPPKRQATEMMHTKCYHAAGLIFQGAGCMPCPGMARNWPGH